MLCNLIKYSLLVRAWTQTLGTEEIDDAGGSFVMIHILISTVSSTQTGQEALNEYLKTKAVTIEY